MSVPILSYVFGEALWARSTVAAMSVDETTIYLPVKPPYRGWEVFATSNLTALLPWSYDTGKSYERGFASSWVHGWEVVRPDGSRRRHEPAPNARGNLARVSNCMAVTFRLGAQVAVAAGAALVLLYDAAASAPMAPSLFDLPARKRMTIAVGLRDDPGLLLTKRFVAFDAADLPSVETATRAALACAQQHWRVPRNRLDALVVPPARRSGPLVVDWQRRRIRRWDNSLSDGETKGAPRPRSHRARRARTA